MVQLTITEALADIKTVDKRIAKKAAFIISHLTRPDKLKDPLVSEGGSVDNIQRETQAIKDLEEHVIKLRMAIAQANRDTTIKIGDVTRSVAEWLTWRRDVAPSMQVRFNHMASNIERARREAQRIGAQVVNSGETAKPEDIIVNVREAQLAKEIEHLEEVLGTLDGQLSLKNATTIIEV